MLNAFLVIELVIGVMLGASHSVLLDSGLSGPMAKFTYEIPDEIDAYNVYTEPDAKYAIADAKIGDLQTKVLVNTGTGEYVQIVTDLGGRIEGLVLLGSDGKLRSVLLTHYNNATAIKENAWWKNVILLPYANRINGVRWYSQYTYRHITDVATYTYGYRYKHTY